MNEHDIFEFKKNNSPRGLRLIGIAAFGLMILVTIVSFIIFLIVFLRLDRDGKVDTSGIVNIVIQGITAALLVVAELYSLNAFLKYIKDDIKEQDAFLRIRERIINNDFNSFISYKVDSPFTAINNIMIIITVLLGVDLIDGIISTFKISSSEAILGVLNVSIALINLIFLYRLRQFMEDKEKVSHLIELMAYKCGDSSFKKILSYDNLSSKRAEAVAKASLIISALGIIVSASTLVFVIIGLVAGNKEMIPILALNILLILNSVLIYLSGFYFKYQGALINSVVIGASLMDEKIMENLSDTSLNSSKEIE